MRFFALLLLVGTVHADGIINDANDAPLLAEFDAEIRVFDDRGEHVGSCDVVMFRGGVYPGETDYISPSITLDCEAGGYELHFAQDGEDGDRIGQAYGRGGPHYYTWWKYFGYDFVEISPTQVASWVDMTVDNGQSLSLNPNGNMVGATFVNATFNTTTRLVQPEPSISLWEQSGTAASVDFEFTGVGDGPITRVVGAGGISQSLSAVPEPSAFLMLSTAGLAAGYRRWRASRRQPRI